MRKDKTVFPEFIQESKEAEKHGMASDIELHLI